MPRISRIHVTVEITEDDGSISTHEVNGWPVVGAWENRQPPLTCSIIPRHHSEIRRSTGELLVSEVADVTVNLQALVQPDGEHPLFRVFNTQPVIALTESGSRPIDWADGYPES
jgi:hypothetical protein